MKKTLVLGASPNPSRYSYLAVQRLHRNDHEVVPVGIRDGEIEGIEINTTRPNVDEVDTVSLYLNPTRQKDYYDYILGLKPQRIIFNPGTENPELAAKAKAQGIEALYACTLVLLATGAF